MLSDTTYAAILYIRIQYIQLPWVAWVIILFQYDFVYTKGLYHFKHLLLLSLTSDKRQRIPIVRKRGTSHRLLRQIEREGHES